MPTMRMRDFRAYYVTVPKNAHPLVKILFQEVLKQQICIVDLAERSGVSRNSIIGWKRNNKNPQLNNLEACLNVVGLGLTTKKIK